MNLFSGLRDELFLKCNCHANSNDKRIKSSSTQFSLCCLRDAVCFLFFFIKIERIFIHCCIWLDLKVNHRDLYFWLGIYIWFNTEITFHSIVYEKYTHFISLWMWLSCWAIHNLTVKTRKTQSDIFISSFYETKLCRTNNGLNWKDEQQDIKVLKKCQIILGNDEVIIVPKRKKRKKKNSTKSFWTQPDADWKAISFAFCISNIHRCRRVRKFNKT